MRLYETQKIITLIAKWNFLPSEEFFLMSLIKTPRKKKSFKMDIYWNKRQVISEYPDNAIFRHTL